MRPRWLPLLLAALLCSPTARAADRDVEPIVSRIRRQPVQSTAVVSVGYSKKLHALEIEFHDGLIYRYEEVPTNVYHDLMSAESKARFYNTNIRGKYHCIRVRPRGGR